MREIKFRGIRIPENTWIYGDIFTGDGYFDIMYRERFDGYSVLKSCIVQKDSIGQFIGIKDKNGIEVFEGDIVKYSSSSIDEGKGMVIYSDNISMFIIENIDYYHTSNFGDISDVEVIGNIYENKELLVEGNYEC